MRFPLIGFLLLSGSRLLASDDFARFVNPLIGTDGHGHTYPGASAPFGMVQLSPDTRVEGWDACSGYHFSDNTILGFSHTHLSGTGIADYGDILFTPTTGEIRLSPGDPDAPRSGYRSGFSHDNEVSEPGYYRVRLEDSGIEAELTATERVGVHRYTFPSGDRGNIIVNLHHGLGPDRVVDSWIAVLNQKEIQGFRRSSGWANDQHIYFHAVFSQPFDSAGVANDDVVLPDEQYASGTNVKGFLSFSSPGLLQVTAKVGLSSVSADAARMNIDAEAPGWNFDDVKSAARADWNSELGRIRVSGGSNDQLTTFYTSLYHTMLAPNLFSDVDGRYRGMDGEVYNAEGFEMYTVFSLWDTFRAEHPLLSIIDRKRTRDFIKSLIAKYGESGTLPVWELASNETWTMIGYHSIPVILDAYTKGIDGFDPDVALEAMVASATHNRFGLSAYREHGYIPGDMKGESVSMTLEYAYDDWCVGRMARILGKEETAETFERRAQSYQNMFDPASRFMRPKSNSCWVEPFDPAAVTFHYTEANAWQYSFFVPHDISGLMNLLGGREAFVGKLDSLFLSSSELTGRKQPDITGLIGQYAHGNEPSHHVAYLYNYAGAPWKTQRLVRQVMDSLYTPRPDGLSGNEDCGQMSAWYVLSALGFYQVCPGDPTYVIGTPIFEEAVIHLENGNSFTIRADGAGPANRFIRSATLNGENHEKSFFSHDDLMGGGDLVLSIVDYPDRSWGSAEENSPHSPASQSIVPLPSAHAKGPTFRDWIDVRLSTPFPEVRIHYTLDGTSPTVRSARYKEQLTFGESTVLKAIAVTGMGESSDVVTASFVRYQPIGTVTIERPYSYQYTGGGDEALVDSRRGGPDWRLGAWQGYEENDLVVVIDLGSVKTIDRVALSCLQDNNSWIFFPKSVEFSFARDKLRGFRNSVVVENDLAPQAAGVHLREFGEELEAIKGRWVRIHARNIGLCPPWHKGAGGKAWLFADEILIETDD